MAKTILVANWKNGPASLEEAKKILKGYGKKRELYKKLSFFIAPPSAYFESVSAAGRGYSKLAVQNLSLAKGVCTGEITPEIQKSFGAKIAILGHSERRSLGETDEEVSRKMRLALKSGLAPLVCVGEKARDAEGEYYEFLRNQIKASLTGLTKQAAASMLVAYEPVWAVGVDATGYLQPEELGQTARFIRKVLSDLFGRAIGEKIPVLYGGSVDDRNAGELLSAGGVQGLLVGRASLNPKSLEQIAQSLIRK